jgi:hypothetical protein
MRRARRSAHGAPALQTLGKSDWKAAEAICEVVMRRSRPVKSPEQQGELRAHRARELLLGQRTALINVLRAPGRIRHPRRTHTAPQQPWLMRLLARRPSPRASH